MSHFMRGEHKTDAATGSSHGTDIQDAELPKKSSKSFDKSVEKGEKKSSSAQVLNHE